MATRTVIEAIASAFTAHENCAKFEREAIKDKADDRPRILWRDKRYMHADRIKALTLTYLPSGSGIDCGTTLDFGASKPERLVFKLSFHHMNDGGMYDGWTEHQAIVTPSFIGGFSIRITGRNRNDIKEYLADTLHSAFSTQISE